MVSHRIGQIDDRVALKNAILSVSDKRGLAEFARGLAEAAPGVSLFSTGGTFRALGEALDADGAKPSGATLTEISEYTGQPETHGGLVKTLDFRIYLGILGEAHNEHHIADRERTEALLFDLLVVNLYPFSETVKDPSNDLEAARSNIDIGGPTMIRAAAKNFPRVAVVCDPEDYESVLEEIRAGQGALSLETRFELARKAFAHVAGYDRAISDYLAGVSSREVTSTYGINL